MISVVVPARNEAARIGACLEALRDQRLPAETCEVIVVDHGSTDDTVRIARSFTPHVHIASGATVGAVRNLGVAHARGDILAFIDADCVASPTWLAAAVAALDEGIVAVGNGYDVPADAGWIEPLWYGRPAPARWRTTELWSGNLVVRRAAFEAAGAFDETLVSHEDVALSRALAQQGSLLWDPGVRVTHIGGPRSLADFARQQAWHGLEEWTMRRRGIARATFWPTMLALGAQAVLAAALVAWLVRGGAPAEWLAAGGAALLVAATAALLARQLRERSCVDAASVARLALLDVVSVSVRAASVVLRAAGRQWSGRRKPISGVPR